MMRQFILGLTVALSVGLSSQSFAGRNPIGETANYQLDRNGARTTSMIQSGTALATVTEFIPDHENGPSYNVNLDYDFVVQFYGRQKGTAKWAFGEEFFDDQFIVNLRERGTFETPDYKIRHEGYADARNLDGGVYPHCDKILIYDVKIPENSDIARLLYASVGIDPMTMNKPPIEDLKIRGHIFAGVPVLGAVKLDLSGIVQGMSAKAGFDLRR
jgi:hypothetical protein